MNLFVTANLAAFHKLALVKPELLIETPLSITCPDAFNVANSPFTDDGTNNINVDVLTLKVVPDICNVLPKDILAGLVVVLLEP